MFSTPSSTDALGFPEIPGIPGLGNEKSSRSRKPIHIPGTENIKLTSSAMEKVTSFTF